MNEPLPAMALCFLLAILGLPGSALAQALQGEPFETTRVANGVYTFRFGIHRNMFLVTNDVVIATDPISPEAARIMMAEIRRQGVQGSKGKVYQPGKLRFIFRGQPQPRCRHAG